MRHALVRRMAPVVAVLVLMAGFGLLVYRALDHFSSVGGDNAALAAPQDPLHQQAAISLPGTIYLSQGGDIFALHDAHFSRIRTHESTGRWMQPVLTPDGSLVAVSRGGDWSDLHLLDRRGTELRQLTHDYAPPARGSASLELAHWAFHPRFSADGRTLFFAFDSPKAGFRVDFAVWAMPWPASEPAAPSPGTAATTPIPTDAKRWTTPNDYTGGDVEPLPLPDGSLAFTRYLIDGKFHVHSQLWRQASAHDAGKALTPPEDDCSQAALSPDGGHVAMVCTHGKQSGDLEIAPLRGDGTLGPRNVVVAGTLCSFPTWAPDGSGVVYLAPAQAGGNFQLWWLHGAAAPSPALPQQVTEGLGLDATSAPAWSA